MFELIEHRSSGVKAFLQQELEIVINCTNVVVDLRGRGVSPGDLRLGRAARRRPYSAKGRGYHYDRVPDPTLTDFASAIV